MIASSGERVLSIFRRRWLSEAVLAVANLGIADHIGDAPMTAADIARAIDAHPDAIYRLLRALSFQGIFEESEPRVFRHTPMSRTLRTDAPDSVVSIIRAAGLPPFRIGATRYEHAIRTGRSGVDEAMGCGPYEYLAAHPEESAIYDASQQTATRLQTQAILESYDFSAFRTLADVGGGVGGLLAAILPSYPALRGVLFDQPHVVAGAAPVLERAGITARCRIEAGDFRVSVPAGCDGYVLKNCLHGWGDDDAARLVRRIHRSSTPGSKLLIIENVMTSEASEMVVAFDLLLLLGGVTARVRSSDEFRALLSAGGFELARVIPLRGFGAIVEANKIDGFDAGEAE